MKELFANCLPYNSDLKARMGGNPPEIIEDVIPENYNFYAVLNHPDKRDMMLSVLIYDNFDILLDKNIYPEIAVKVLEHKYSEMGTRADKSIPSLEVSSISDYSETESEFLFIKVGGEPRLIQPKKYFYEKLEEEDYFFFMQIEEEGYRDGLDYVFMYGALYLYKHKVTNEVIAGFWQYS
ncbi:hypothetical protein [Chryseobacterium sp. c4a]|uniref:hypothetical protein n=1 Tax=Chryseobacterium sp. c4a TaxID=1573582 RepID=UPI00135B46EC|nr:hypothetical protein [Chryseobacterium sp. c4a]